jgi:hypothetical protein
MPHGRFEDVLCPWPGCGFSIWFVDFRLEFNDPLVYQKGVNAWQQGLGLIACCPGCGHKVVFSQSGKSCVQGDLIPEGAVMLRDTWFEQAILLDAEGNVIRF